MRGIVFDKKDGASYNVASYLIEEFEFEERQGNIYKSKENRDIVIVESDVELINAEFVDSLGFSIVYFLSKHESNAGIGAFTTHATGNWRPSADLGGKPKQLSYAAPLEMLGVLREESKINTGISATYEATHHGPLLKTPSLFVELGGDKKMIENKELAMLLGDALWQAIMQKEVEFEKVVIGIGSNHYPQKFTALAIEKGLAFSHIFPKYAFYNPDNSDNTDMLVQAVERSKIKPEIAVIEKHSFNAREREEIIKRLNDIGIGYEMV